jgi:hypothetical protein
MRDLISAIEDLENQEDLAQRDVFCFDCRMASWNTLEDAMSVLFWRASDAYVNGVSDMYHSFRTVSEGYHSFEKVSEGDHFSSKSDSEKHISTSEKLKCLPMDKINVHRIRGILIFQKMVILKNSDGVDYIRSKYFSIPLDLDAMKMLIS